MCSFVQSDTWFRALSLNHLNLPKEAIELLVDCLGVNVSIIQLGLEYAEGIT